jgi:hypothetical protein
MIENKNRRQELFGAVVFAAIFSAILIGIDVITSFGNWRSLVFYVVAYLSLTVAIVFLIYLSRMFNLR